MNKQLNGFLLGVLWVLAVLLGGNFWMDVRYGFNIFSGSHWRYLGELQTAGTAISIFFYISLIVIALAAFSGLWIILRPRIRRRIQIETPRPIADTPIVETTLQNMADGRPPRLNVPLSQPAPRTPAPTPAQAPTPELEPIFRDAGYIVKKTPRIGGFRPDLFAIGGNENLWIGGVDAGPADIQNAADRLQATFTETLEDVPIHIHAFVVAPKSPYTGESAVQTFADINALREFMAQNPAPTVAADDTENFEAYSEYIDTVADYFDTRN